MAKKPKQSVSPTPSRFVILINSDSHSNHLLGLCPPHILFQSGQGHNALKSQVGWQWPSWLDYCNAAKQIIAEKAGTRVISVLNGDIGELDAKGRTTALITHNPVDVLSLMKKAHEPVTELSDRVYVIRGTEAHSGQDAWIEELFARIIGAEPAPAETIDRPVDLVGGEPVYEPSSVQHARWALLSEWGGVRFDITHHGRSFGRAWTSGSAAVTVAAETVIACHEAGEPVPDLVIRGHGHSNTDSYDMIRGCRSIMTLGWQMTGVGQAHIAHVRRIQPVIKASPIGGLIIVAEDGQYKVVKQYYWPPTRVAETWNE